VLKIADNGFSDVGRQRHLSPMSTFAAEAEVTVLPVDVIKGETHDLIRTEAQSAKQQQNGVIPLADGAVLIALSQHLANLIRRKELRELGKKGGKARLETRTKDERKESARKAALARWAKRGS
jgi:hypothetical protein